VRKTTQRLIQIAGVRAEIWTEPQLYTTPEGFFF
jgi:hypothetical protein